MGYDFALQGESFAVHPVHRPGRSHLAIEGRAFSAELFPGLVPGEHFLEIDGRPVDPNSNPWSMLDGIAGEGAPT